MMIPGILLELYDKSASGEPLTKRDALALCQEMERSPWDVFYLAGRLRERRFGDKVDPCSIINARSGNCPEDCSFCAQSAHHGSDADVYPLLPEERVVEAAGEALSHGVRRFCIVTSGRGVEHGKELDTIARYIGKLRGLGIMPCATLGAMDKDSLKTLRDAGLNRYHHNLETSEAYFPKICTTHNYRERIETIEAAKEIGLSVCSGGIIGMGEDASDRVDMALALRELDVDSVPINFLMPAPGTPLEKAPTISPLEALKTIALFRFLLPDKEIRVCGGRLRGLGELHPMMFMAGANGLLTGNYLTMPGRDFEADRRMIEGLGLRIGYE